MTTTSETVTIHPAGDGAQDDECGANGCGRQEQQGQPWTIAQGRIVARSGLSVVMEWANACPEHREAATRALIEAMPTYGAPWDVERLTYDADGTAHRAVMTHGDAQTAAATLF